MDIPASGGKELMRIKVLNGPEKGEEFHVKKREVTIGPGQDMDIHSPFESVDAQTSAGHARITIKGDGYWLEDLGGGGTSVNGHKIDKEVRLEIESTFRLGQITFKLIEPSVERDVLLREQIIKTIIT
jgi:pSer/pThr/pTyr-binding forkhead associated (FHA) protein